MRPIASLLLLFIASCAAINPEKEAIQRLIAKYNLAVVAAYKDLNMEPLKALAVESHYNKVNGIIDAYLAGDEVMESELLKLAFENIKIEKDKAVVRTSEDWKYQWVDMKTREVKEPLKDIHYEMIYHLVKKDGKWLVEKAEEVKGSSG